MTKSRIFIPELDGLRFIAFLLIFIHHSSVQHIFLFDQIKTAGWLGVEIFFCLSAFLLTRLLRYEIQQMGSIDVFKFFVRRVLRIWPLYLTYVILAILFSFYEHLITEENWYRVLGLLTFTDNIFTAFKGFNPILFTGHLWTISYEEQFYFLLPFLIPWLVRLKFKSRIYFFVGAFIVGSFVRGFSIYFDFKDPFIWTFPITHFESILVGIVIGFYEQEFMKISKKVIITILLLSITSIVFLPETNVIAYHLLIVYPIAGIFSGSVLCYLLNAEIIFIKKALSNKIVAFAGKISFGLYVFHIFCMRLVDYLMGISNPVLNLFISLFLILIVASLSYFILEKRFLVMKERFMKIPSRV
jgi:peptidoglycan/LPS O-acetylase OafA/YrhL